MILLRLEKIYKNKNQKLIAEIESKKNEATSVEDVITVLSQSNIVSGSNEHEIKLPKI